MQSILTMSEQVIHLKVKGMTGTTCEAIVANLIVDERGVEKVTVSFEKGSAEIYGSYKLNKTQIVNSINLSGKYHAE